MYQWTVTYEYRERGAEHWTWMVLLYEFRATAEAAYETLKGKPGGPFGPFEYRRITLAQIHRQLVA